VPQTFEEFAGQYIDGLYHGALFLNGGVAPPAEDLVLWTLTGAFQDFRQIGEGTALEAWIEGRLVEVFLARSARSTDDGSTDALPADTSRADVPWSQEASSGAVEIDGEALLRAGEKLPPRARAAIWLVLFRRWSYGEASRVLETDVEGLKGLLQYRQVLLTAVVSKSADWTGTDQDRRQ